MKEKIRLNSKYLNKDISVGFVCPKDGGDRIMIFLHGSNGSFEDLDDKLPLQEYADTYNLIIVCPNLGNDYYIDHPAQKKYYGSFLAEELPAYVKNYLKICPDMDWILGGISMGGYGSVLTACHFPESFKYVISVGGAFIAHDVSIGNPEVVGSTANTAVTRYFLDIFGPDVSDLDCSVERNPLAALNCIAEKQNKPLFWLGCGTEDLLYPRNLQAVKVFKNNKIPYQWFEMPGDHTFACFDTGIWEALNWVSSQ